MGILSVDLDKINLDNDNNFDEMILKLSFMSDCWLGVMIFKNAKHLKNKLENTWHSTRWWNWCISEDENNEIDPVFIDEVGR